MSIVMVVDDNRFMRKRISQVLTENGYETVMAEDGEHAVQVYRSVRPDATLLDVTMPKKDGIEALTEIRQLDPAAKVIMLTALNQQSVMVQAVQLGAKDFLTKPVVPERLMAALQKVLR